MNFFSRFRPSREIESSALTHEQLRLIWESYSDQWAENNDKYSGWKPESVLPASKSAIKQAVKLAYKEWPEPVEWQVFSLFGMQFSDLANHLPKGQYEAIARLRHRPYLQFGKNASSDPLLEYKLSAFFAGTIPDEFLVESVVRIRDGLRRSELWDPVDTSELEIDRVRAIILESTLEFASAINEWRLYMLSIGKDRYI